MESLKELSGCVAKRALIDQEWNGNKLREIAVRGDGNCLFRSFAYCLRGIEDQWPEFRENAARYMNTQISVSWADGESPESIRAGGWGGPLSVEALARCYRVKVFVFGVLTDGETYIGYRVGKDDDPVFFLAFRGYHFNPVILEDDYVDYFQYIPKETRSKKMKMYQ